MEDFFEKWKPQLERVSCLLQYLHKYPGVLYNLDMKDLIMPDELYKRQKEWLRLHSKFKGMEQEFFKSYWIPIERDRNCCDFIDISDENLPIIYPVFDKFNEPYHLEKKFLFKSSKEFMSVMDNTNIYGGLYRDKEILRTYKKYFSFKSNMAVYFNRIVDISKDILEFITFVIRDIWDYIKLLLKKIGILNLYFSDIEEDGSIICRHCGFSEAVVKEIYTKDEKYFFHLGLQCQSCGKIHYYWSYKSRWGWQRDSICDICGGKVEDDKPIFCPKCKSKNIKYIKLKKK